MADLTYYIATTLDGFIADDAGDTSFFPADNDYLAALATEYPETFPGQFREPFGISDAANRHFDTVVMGRHTYQPALDAGLTSPYPHLDQHVVSSTLEGDADSGITVIGSDPLGAIRDLKMQDRLGIWLCGGGVLAASLVGEIDQLILKVNPVAIGAGRPLFDSHIPRDAFTHTGSTTHDNGVIVLRYSKAA